MRIFFSAVLILVSPGLAPYRALAANARASTSGTGARVAPRIAAGNVVGDAITPDIRTLPAPRNDAPSLRQPNASPVNSAKSEQAGAAARPASPTPNRRQPARQVVAGAAPSAMASTIVPIAPAAPASLAPAGRLEPSRIDGAFDVISVPRALGELNGMTDPQRPDRSPAASFDGARPRRQQAAGAVVSAKPARANTESAVVSQFQGALDRLIPEAGQGSKITIEEFPDGSRKFRLEPDERPAEPAGSLPQNRWKTLILSVGTVTVLALLAHEIATGQLGASVVAGVHGWKLMLRAAFLPYVAVALGLYAAGKFSAQTLKNQMVVKIVRLMYTAGPKELFWFFGPRMAAVVSFEELAFRAILFSGLLSLLTLLQVPFAFAIAAVVAAALFSAVHIPGWGFHWLTFAMRLVLGVILTKIYADSHSLMAPVVAHFLFNTANLTVTTIMVRLYRKHLQPLAAFEDAYYKFHRKPRPSFLWTMLHPRQYFGEIRLFREALLKDGELAAPAPPAP